MPNDAKLGMVVGMGLVIVVAVLFYRKELPAQGAAAPASMVSPAGMVDARQSALPALPSPENDREPVARPVSRTEK